MASLVMTIDSSDDELEREVLNTNQKGQKGTAAKAGAKKTAEGGAALTAEERAGDLVMASKALEDPANALFLEESGDDAGGLEFQRKEDGGRAATWSFKQQLTLDARTSRRPGTRCQDTDDTDETQRAIFSMQDRVLKHLRLQNVQIAEELQQLEEQRLNSDQKEDVIDKAAAVGADAKLHYDPEDLIQFHELMLSKPLVRACAALDYDHPTVIQRQTIPAVLEGHDILAHSVTGSGKTAAYLLPLLQKYLKSRQTQQTEMGKLRYLILQPTRELAAQSHSMLQNLSKFMPPQFTSCAVFGGSSLKDQKRLINSESPDVMVATTGRLIDHIHNTKGFTLEDVELLVLDEADRLLEMGFKEELMTIVKQCRHPKRQTLMVSATLNQDLKELAQLALKQPLSFSVDKQQKKADLSNIKLTQYLVRLQFEGLNAPKKDQRRFSVVKRAKVVGKNGKNGKKRRKLDPDDPDFDSEAEYGEEAREYVSSSEEEDSNQSEEEEADAAAKATKQHKGGRQALTDSDFVIRDAPLDEYLIKREATLIALLKRSFKTRVIIFANEKVQCTRLMALMTMYGFKAAEVHGNLSQPERLKSVESFQAGEVDYLVATDLIARGLDISNVKAVINFSFPTEPKRYLHRIGRTARAGQHGVAITLCNEEERKDLKKLSRKLNQNVNTFTIQNKFVEPIFTTMASKLAKVVAEIQCELEQEREMAEAMKELERSENLIKYQKEIHSRPKKEWFMGKGRRDDIVKESKGDLKSIKDKFESQLGQQQQNRNKRQKKRDHKDESAQKAPADGKHKEQQKGGQNKERGNSQGRNSKTPNKSFKGPQSSNGKPPQSNAAAKPTFFKKKKHLGKKK